jgi:hypothetical protein
MVDTDIVSSQSFCVDLRMDGHTMLVCDDLHYLGEYLVEKSFFFSYSNLVCDSPAHTHWFIVY